MKNYLRSASILMFAIFAAKFIGAFFRIPLTNIIGAEGMGLYQLVFSIYSLILSTSSGALPTAVSILVSRHTAKGENQKVDELVGLSLSMLLMTGLALTAAFIALSRVIADFQGNSLAALGYVAIAPSIFFVSGIAVMRGYFQGKHNAVPSALSQITEAVIKLVAGLLMAYIFLPYGIQYAVFGALAGVTVSEVVTFFIMLYIYRRHNHAPRLTKSFSQAKAGYKEIIKISIPLTLGGIILPLTQFIDSVLVVNVLARFAREVNATASYGIMTGSVTPLVNLPVMLILTLGVFIIPQLTHEIEQHNIHNIKSKCESVSKLCFVIGVPFTFLFLVMPEVIISLIYSGLSAAEAAIAVNLLRLGSCVVLLQSAMQISAAILQGIDKTMVSVKNLAIGAVIKVVLNVLLMPTLGIYGVMTATVASFGAVLMLNYLHIKFYVGKLHSVAKNAGIVAAAGAIMGAVIYAAARLSPSRLAPVLAALAGGVVYLIAILRFGVFSQAEIYSMPFGRQIAKISKLLGNSEQAKTD